MISLRKSEDRGHVNHGWLDSFHTFSFSDYYDPRFMGFRHLRVINEDRVAPGEGFDTHPHNDMEIITYVLDGKIEHKDSMGTGSVILPGDVQRMTAGTGVTHSEFNGSKTDPLHLLQIWIFPDKKGLKPSYEQKSFSADEKRGKFRIVASPDGREGSVTIHQDASLSAVLLAKGESVSYQNPSKRHAWVQVARGSVRINEMELSAGDALAISGEELIKVAGLDQVGQAEILLFDLS